MKPSKRWFWIAPFVTALLVPNLISSARADELDELNLTEFSEGGASPAKGEEKPSSQADAEDSLEQELTLQMNRAVVRKVADEGTGPGNVTNLEFKSDASAARIVLSANRRLRYTENRSEGTNQIVYLFENLSTPEKFQRAFDTTEFNTAVGIFTLFQIPGSNPPQSKLIVQLRNWTVPEVVEGDRGLTVQFPPAARGGDPKIVDHNQKSVLDGDSIYARGGKFSGEVIQRLEIKNSDVQDVLRLIARTSGYNIVIGEEVQGKVGTLSLTNVPWDQAFLLVLQSKQLGFVKEGKVLRVGSSASLAKEKTDAAALESAQAAVEPLKTVLIPINYAKAIDLVEHAKPYLTKDRGSATFDTRTNTVMIRDIAATADRVQKLLQSLDTQPPRVHMEIKVVEMRADLTRSLGLGFSNSFLSGSNSLSVGTPFPTGTDGMGITLSAPDFASLTAQLRAYEVDNSARILATPSLTVTANQQGVISEGQTNIIPTTTGGVGVAATATTVESRLLLRATPYVSSDGSIAVDLTMDNDVPKFGQNNTFAVNRRNLTTRIMVDNGDTAVLGGVFQGRTETVKDGVPWLMNLPLLGYLFSRTNSISERREVFIFLTAKILNPEESFKRNI